MSSNVSRFSERLRDDNERALRLGNVVSSLSGRFSVLRFVNVLISEGSELIPQLSHEKSVSAVMAEMLEGTAPFSRPLKASVCNEVRLKTSDGIAPIVGKFPRSRTWRSTRSAISGEIDPESLLVASDNSVKPVKE
jgi:hypothetical protein